MCCEDYIHCWGNAAPSYISKCRWYTMPTTARSCSTTFVQRSGENDHTWWYRTPSFFMTMQGVTALLLSRTSCSTGNGRFWNIHHTHPMWTHAITISSPEWTTDVSTAGSHLCICVYITRDELIHTRGRSIRNINIDGRVDGVRRLPNIWRKGNKKGGRLCQRNIKRYILWIKPLTVAITFYSTLVLSTIQNTIYYPFEVIYQCLIYNQ